MNRATHRYWLALVCCLALAEAVAQDREVDVKLFAMAAHDHRDAGPVSAAAYPFPIVTEYKELIQWISPTRNSTHRSPNYFELVAILSNRSEEAAIDIKLELRRRLKVGGLEDISSPLYPTEPWRDAQWQESRQVATLMIDVLAGKTGTIARFGPFAANTLWDPLPAEMWPWYVEYEIILRCGGCAPESEAMSFFMHHGE